MIQKSTISVSTIEGFTEYLAGLGVETGARKSKVDILQVQENLLDTFSELSWVSINIFGTKAQVEYMYAKPQKEIADNLGISQSYISRLEKRIISKLKRSLEKAGA